MVARTIERSEIHDLLNWGELKLFFKRYGNKHLILELKKTAKEPKIISLRWNFKTD